MNWQKQMNWQTTDELAKNINWQKTDELAKNR